MRLNFGIPSNRLLICNENFKMSYKFDETSKSSAFKLALFNAILTFLLTILLVAIAAVIFHYYDEVTATHVTRLILVEITLNFLFFPFAIILIIGIKKEKYKWIRIWIKAKVVQASYLLLLNFVMQVYITCSMNVFDGLVVLGYTILVEAFYMQTIMFMNNYHKYQTKEENEDLSTKDDEPIRF